MSVSWDNREQMLDWHYDDYAEMNGVKIPSKSTARIYLSDKEKAGDHFDPCESYVSKKMDRYDLTYKVSQKRGTSAYNLFTSDKWSMLTSCKDEAEAKDRKEAKQKLENALSLVNSVNALADKHSWPVKSVSRDPEQKAIYKVAHFKLSADLSNQRQVEPVKKAN